MPHPRSRTGILKINPGLLPILVLILFCTLLSSHAVKAGTVQWTNVNPNPTSNALLDILWDGARFIVLGSNGTILTSPDGLTWSRNNIGTKYDLTGIAKGVGHYVVVGHETDGNPVILTSSNGTDWLPTFVGATKGLNAVAWNGSQFVAVGDKGTILTSTDGSSWEEQIPLDSYKNLYDVIWNGSLYVVTASQGAIWTSADGITWTARDSGTQADLNAIAWNGSVFVAAGNQYVTLSQDGITWKPKIALINTTVYSDITWTGTQFIAVTKYGQIDTSVDGINWFTVQPQTFPGIHAVASNGTRSVTVGDSGSILVSSDGATWTNPASGEITDDLNAVLWAGSQYVAVGNSGTILTSPDGVDWTRGSSGTSQILNAVIWARGLYVAVGDNGTIVTSPDGTNWTVRAEYWTANALTYEDFTAIIATDSVFIAVGQYGHLFTSPDGVNWTLQTTSSTPRLSSVASNGSVFVGVGGTAVYNSVDGITWTQVAGYPEIKSNLLTVDWKDSRFVAVGKGSEGIIATSEDGITWTDLNLRPDPLYSVTHSDFQIVAVGFRSSRYISGTGDAVAWTSPDGINWSDQRLPSVQLIYDVNWNGAQFVAIGANGTILVGKESPDLSVSGSVSPQFIADGDHLNYQYTISNDGAITATNVTFTDTLPPALSFLSASSTQGICDFLNTTFSCQLGNLPRGAVATIDLESRIDIPTGPIVNIASTFGTNGDADLSDNAVPLLSSVGYTDIAVEATSNTNSITTGMPFSYNVTVTNLSPYEATGVTLRAGVPNTDISYTPSQGSCERSPQNPWLLECDIGTLAGNANATVAVTITPNHSGSFQYSVDVASRETDSNSDNNHTSVLLTAGDLNLFFASATTSATAAPGHMITLTYTVENGSYYDGSHAIFTASLAPGLQVSSSSSSTGSCAESAGVLSCDLGALPAHVQETIIIDVVASLEGTYQIDAAISDDLPEQYPDDNAVSSTIAVIRPDLLLTVYNYQGYAVTVDRPGTIELFIWTKAGPASDVTVSAELPPGFVLLSFDASQGVCAQDQTTLSCDLGNLPKGVIDVRLRYALGIAGPANITFAVTSDDLEVNPDDNSFTLQQAAGYPDLEVTGASIPDEIAIGDSLFLKYLVSNGSMFPAFARLTIPLPDGVTFRRAELATSSASACSEMDRVVSCDLGDIGPTNPQQVVLEVTADTAGSTSYVATAVTDSVDGNETNNSASIAVVVADKAGPDSGGGAFDDFVLFLLALLFMWRRMSPRLSRYTTCARTIDCVSGGRPVAFLVFSWCLLMVLFAMSTNVEARNIRWSYSSERAPDAALNSMINAGSLFVAVGDKGTITTSTDGTDWVVQDTDTDWPLNAVAWNGNQYVAVGDHGTIVTSPDAIHWFSVPPDWSQSAPEQLLKVFWTGSTFVAWGRTVIGFSPDGIRWRFTQPLPVYIIWDISWNGDIFVASGCSSSYCILMTSRTGHDWKLRYEPQEPLRKTSWNGNRFVAVGDNGAIITSTDGINWHDHTISDPVYFRDIVWNGTLFVAGGIPYSVTDTTTKLVYTSPDGIAWSPVALDFRTDYFREITDIAWNGTQWIAVGSSYLDGEIFTSPDGAIWTPRPPAQFKTVSGVSWNGSQNVIFGKDIRGLTIINTSSDGMAWSPSTDRPTSQGLRDVVWTGTQFVSVGGTKTAPTAYMNADILTSNDGIHWTPHDSGTTNSLQAICWTGTQFVAVGLGGVIVTSPDGITWTPRDSGTEASLYAVTWNGAQLLAGGDGGTILTSTDGSSWNMTVTNPLFSINDVLWDGAKYVAVGRKGTILTSVDGIDFLERLSGTDLDLIAITWNGDQYVSVGAYRSSPRYTPIVTSSDGFDWTVIDSGAPESIYAVAWSGTEFTAVGGKTILTSPAGESWVDNFPATGGAGSPWGIPLSSSLTDIEWVNSYFLAIGGGTVLFGFESPDLAIKNIDYPDVVQIDSAFTYTYTISNDSAFAATAVTITDELPDTAQFISATPSQGSCYELTGTVTCDAGVLAPGADLTVAIAVVPHAPGHFHDKLLAASAEQDADNSNNLRQLSIPVGYTDLSIAVLASTTSPSVGGTYTYTLTMSNDGAVDASGAVVTGYLPPEFDILSITPNQGTCSVDSDKLMTCEIGVIPPSANTTIFVTGSPIQPATMKYQARVFANEYDTNAENNITSASVTADFTSLYVDGYMYTTTPVPNTLTVGSRAEYRLYADTYDSPHYLATGVVLTIDFNDTATVLSTPDNCTSQIGEIVCSLSEPDSSFEYTNMYFALIPQEAGSLVLTAAISANEPEISLTDNSKKFTTTIIPNDISMTGNADPSPPEEGERLTYDYTISNHSAFGSSEITFTDTLPDGLTFLSVHSSQGFCKEENGDITCYLGILASGADVSVTVDVVPETSGDVTNTAAATIPTPDADDSDNLVVITMAIDASSQADGQNSNSGGGGGAFGWLLLSILLFRSACSSQQKRGRRD